MDKANKKILLCVTGLSPQVITETLYALAVEPDLAQRWIPDEVHVITTLEGAERVQLTLLDEAPGWFNKIRQDYELPDILFNNSTIHIMQNKKSEDMDDIRTIADNTAAADYIYQKVYELCQQKNTQLHVSLAGGRKTMGFYVGYALSLNGRKQDRLSHVLVSSPYESLKDFYYPSKNKNVIYQADGKPLDAKNAKITLAEIPFVRMKQAQDHQLEDGKISFSQAVEQAQQDIGEPELMINLMYKSFMAHGKPIKLSASELAFYCMIVIQQQATGKGVHWSDENLDQLFKCQYLKMVGDLSGHYIKAEEALKDGMDKDFFDSKKSKINRKIKQALGEKIALPYLLQKLDKIPKTKYYHFGTILSEQQIKIK